MRVSTNKLSVQDFASERRLSLVQVHLGPMRLRNMFVNILRQIDTRVIPCNSLAAVCLQL
jgi:hypothetical protein